jgi:putative restriction endonuclease
MFDTPVYKILAPNDTGGAKGHQGGIVIPAAIEDFFPDVVGAITPESPTADVPVIAELLVDGRSLGRVQTRYQYQTWGGTRTPERRLTSSLGPLRNAANPGDIVLFSRDPEKPELMLLTLLRVGSTAYEQIVSKNPRSRWGVVPGLPQPVSNNDIRLAQDFIDVLSSREFFLFDEERPMLETPIWKKARRSAFRKSLVRVYGPSCMATGDFLETPDGLFNIDAAHIVPVESGGSDDLRNGLLFGKDVHWAFDKGLFSVSDNHEIIVSKFVKASENCDLIKRLEGNILRSSTGSLIAHREAISWHRKNRFLE